MILAVSVITVWMIAQVETAYLGHSSVSVCVCVHVSVFIRCTTVILSCLCSHFIIVSPEAKMGLLQRGCVLTVVLSSLQLVISLELFKLTSCVCLLCVFCLRTDYEIEYMEKIGTSTPVSIYFSG